ncbi:MAG: hypothetical protein WBA57_00555 [Elainellaceae cyanobacterium]
MDFGFVGDFDFISFTMREDATERMGMAVVDHWKSQWKKRGRAIAPLLLLAMSSWGLMASVAWAEEEVAEPSFIRPAAECPEDVEAIAPIMMRDIPDYGNRVSQRSRRSNRYFVPQSHILRAESLVFDSLDPRGDGLIPSEAELAANGLKSIFFTTLERQYLESDIVMLQHYHWTFLVETQEGWHLAFMYSRLGDFPTSDPPSPPRNSSQGVIAEAVRLWLRDCQAGAIDPVESEGENASLE